MTHMVHKRAFSEGKTIPAPLPTTCPQRAHTDTQSIRVNTYVVNSVTDQALSARARALARFSYALYVKGSNSRPLTIK